MDLGTGLLKLSREDRAAQRAIMLDRRAVKKSGRVKHFSPYAPTARQLGKWQPVAKIPTKSAKFVSLQTFWRAVVLLGFLSNRLPVSGSNLAANC